MPSFTYQVTLIIERVEGQIASNDSIRERIEDAFGDFEPDLSGLGPQEMSEYEVADTSVEEVTSGRR